MSDVVRGDLNGHESLSIPDHLQERGRKHCSECCYAVAVPMGDSAMLECRRYPPTLHLVLIPPGVMGGAPKLQKQSGFPNCDKACGEFDPALGDNDAQN